MSRKRRGLQLFLVLSVFGLLLASGCATDGTLSREKILRGDEAVRKAAESNATLNASKELNVAEGKLVQAREAFAKKDFNRATRLAEEASIDADYARSKAASEKARKMAEELREDIRVLRQEVDDLSKQ
jgi:macrodomain Ter protein organizer (MatP/YcbG family)